MRCESSGGVERGPDVLRQRRVLDLFEELLGRPREERTARLDTACAGEDDLRREVEGLLDLDDEPSDFLAIPLPGAGSDSAAGHRIGPYELVRRLGRGGMGDVYLAVRRGGISGEVALKIVPRGLRTAEVVRRFLAERQILARLEHPRIARLLDGGSTDDDYPYFVMEYVDGEPILGYCERRGLALRRRLELFLKVCEAVRFAHRHLVVHRDLKSANILVTEAGEPKLLDFGIAKILTPDCAEEDLTRTGRTPMTPRYASPEQLAGEPVTTATDVYGLGLLLYELLTGTYPYRPASGAEADLARAIREQEPERPSTALGRRRGDATRALRRRLLGDLDSIVVKALAKRPERRYASVEALAEDLGRHLRGLPVRARRGSFVYQAGKFLRQPWGVAFLVLVFAVAAVAGMWRRAEREQERAEEIMAVAEELLEVPDPELFERSWQELLARADGEPELAVRMLNTLGRMYYKQGLYEDSCAVAEQTVTILKRQVGGDDPVLARELNNWATCLYQLGHYYKAEALFREVLAMKLRLGEGGKALVRPRNNLASVLLERQAYDEAETLYRQTLDIRVELYGRDDEDVATSLRHLGNLYYRRGESERAAPLLREALELRRRWNVGEPAKIASVLDKLGSVVHALGRLDEAESLLREALDLREKLLDGEHVDLARSRKNLAAVLVQRGAVDDAEALLGPALRVLRQRKPESRELAEAEDLRRRLVELRRASRR